MIVPPKARARGGSRAQQREYTRNGASRQFRLHTARFGAWRKDRPFGSYESWASQTGTSVFIAPRKERRPKMIRDAKAIRRLLRKPPPSVLQRLRDTAWSRQAKQRAEAGLVRDDTEWAQAEADRLREIKGNG